MRKVTTRSEDLYEAVVGAGAGTLEWYRMFEPVWSQQVVHVSMDDGEDGHSVKTLSVADMRQAIVALYGDIPHLFDGIDWEDPDIDVEIADCILQQAMLGRVIFA